MNALIFLVVVFLSLGSAFMSTGALKRRHTSTRLEELSMSNVLIVGGTRFSGLYLWKELHARGHSVTLFNRGKTALEKLPGRETDEEFDARVKATTFITGDRKDVADMSNKLKAAGDFEVVYDLGGREREDTEPLVDALCGPDSTVKHFVYMSSAGVYKPSSPNFLPYNEDSDVDAEKSRHKGKLHTEDMLRERGVPFTSIRPTYIYGPLNYNPIEGYFFGRLDCPNPSEKGADSADSSTSAITSTMYPICIPGHGQHLTGLGHVEDLATAMAQVIGRPQCIGQVYNVQDRSSVTFQGLAQLCAQAVQSSKRAAAKKDKQDNKDNKKGKKDKGEEYDADKLQIQYYDKDMFDFGKKKAFPMREQHFFTSIEKAMVDLDWVPKWDLQSGLLDSYENDYLPKKAAGLVVDRECDELILGDDRVKVVVYDGYPADDM